MLLWEGHRKRGVCWSISNAYWKVLNFDFVLHLASRAGYRVLWVGALVCFSLLSVCSYLGEFLGLFRSPNDHKQNDFTNLCFKTSSTVSLI